MDVAGSEVVKGKVQAVRFSAEQSFAQPHGSKALAHHCREQHPAGFPALVLPGDTR